MKVLVIGGGGREHALAWRLAQAPSVSELHCAPGNPGSASVAKCHLSSDYVVLAESLGIDLTVVGPEAPLVAGVVDKFRAAGRYIVGPTAQNAALEGSKIYSKRFMEKLGIPTARFETVGSPDEARAAFAGFRFPLVLKTDGLAAGKGVVIAQTQAEAEDALTQLTYPLVMEEFLEGEEVSFIALCDGKTAVALEPSQDHKRIFDNDEGPNTGGMGAYSHSGLLTPEQRSHILEAIILPVVHATSFTGFLYAGLMMTASGPSVLEFNVRMGDPETQPLMMRLDCDWAEALMASARGALTGSDLRWKPQPATCVVLASAGYPGVIESHKLITGLDAKFKGEVFHAGTRQTHDGIVTAGGRVLGVTALGDTLQASIHNAYAGVRQIQFDGMQYRKDIGVRGLRRLQ
ncbi:MAG: phosphoribosylamine--glycine ligase [Bryobacterales bacterium]|nr:phosphoribosylamine--glycine ligase [Bryobacterales bacterium]